MTLWADRPNILGSPVAQWVIDSTKNLARTEQRVCSCVCVCVFGHALTQNKISPETAGRSGSILTAAARTPRELGAIILAAEHCGL